MSADNDKEKKPKKNDSKPKRKAPPRKKKILDIEIVYTADGKEFELPAQLEEYRKNNPVGAAEYEKRRAAELEKEKKDKRIINIPTEPIPELDPNSPQFDKELYAECSQKAHEAMEHIKEQYGGIVAENLQQFAQVAVDLTKTLSPVMDAIKGLSESIYNSEVVKSYAELLRTIANNSEGIKALFEEQEALQPYLDAELRKSKYGELTLEQFVDLEDGEEKDAEWSRIYAAAKAAKEKDEKATKVKAKRADIVAYPLDKVNSTIWNMLKEDTGGQITMRFAAENREDKKKKKEVDILYSINFDALEGEAITITKKLLPFDKRVYLAVAALFNAGNDVVSFTQIYYAMGNTNKPAPNQIKKIEDAVNKMMRAAVEVNNVAEAKAYNYPKFTYKGALLPVEFVTAKVNGTTAEGAVHIFREPPVITFARERRQITTIDIKLLQSPMNKTDANLSIDDYLIERISRAKGKKTEKILYATLYAQAGITTTKQKQRAADKITGYLDYYKKCSFIKGYSMTTDGIIIDLK